jgi:hypothetical protein
MHQSSQQNHYISPALAKTNHHQSGSLIELYESGIIVGHVHDKINADIN